MQLVHFGPLLTEDTNAHRDGPPAGHPVIPLGQRVGHEELSVSQGGFQMTALGLHADSQAQPQRAGSSWWSLGLGRGVPLAAQELCEHPREHFSLSPFLWPRAVSGTVRDLGLLGASEWEGESARTKVTVKSSR